MSDTVLIAAIGAIVTITTGIFAGLFGVQLARINRVSNATHKLVNGRALALARLYATSTRRLATLTQDADDSRAADVAEAAVTALEHTSESPSIATSQPRP